MQFGAATVESSMEIPLKIKYGPAFWPSNPTPRNISKGTQNTNSKEHRHSSVHCSIIYNHQDMQAGQVVVLSLDEWIKQLWDTYTIEYYLVIKKKEILPFAVAQMDLESIMLSEISQLEKDKYHMISLICGI